MPRRVWILGAGFSKPLGGPLLNQLVTREALDDARNCFGTGDGKHPVEHDALDEAVWLYAYGRKFQDYPKHGSWQGEWLWDNAEHYLEYLDAADEAGPESAAYRRLGRIMQVRTSGSGPVDRDRFQRTAAAARRLIAAACSGFMAGADVRSERWSPHLKWAEQLGPDDTIVTFNYDCVLEKLNATTKTMAFVGVNERGAQDAKARVLKLHGSVNWRLVFTDPKAKPRADEKVQIRQEVSDTFAVSCADHEIALATPGPSKKRVSGWFEPLWTEACEAIRSATMIAFVGYRFPQSDSTARSRLIEAVSQNKEPYLAVHTVLGPEETPDTRRLDQMLRYALAEREEIPPGQLLQDDFGRLKFNLVRQPLWTEDFFSVIPGGYLLQPYRLRRR